MDDSHNLMLSQRSQTQRVHTACDTVTNKRKYSFKKKKEGKLQSERHVPLDGIRRAERQLKREPPCHRVTSLVAQTVKNLSVMQETRVPSPD